MSKFPAYFAFNVPIGNFPNISSKSSLDILFTMILMPFQKRLGAMIGLPMSPLAIGSEAHAGGG
ncbi:MAG TPA: hypothetical protein PLU67_01225 [Candidatus Kapabacteria bacterium]|nr:hypothetical protein [Candidatus Kapabacteria bacterium]